MGWGSFLLLDLCVVLIGTVVPTSGRTTTHVERVLVRDAALAPSAALRTYEDMRSGLPNSAAIVLAAPQTVAQTRPASHAMVRKVVPTTISKGDRAVKDSSTPVKEKEEQNHMPEATAMAGEARTRPYLLSTANKAQQPVATKSREQPFYMTLQFLLPLLTGLVVLELALAIGFEALHSRWAAVDMNVPLPSMHERSRTPLPMMFNGFLRLMMPYFTGPEGARGRLSVLVVLGLSVMGLFVSYVHNAWQKEWWDLFNRVEAERFPKLMGYFVVIVVASMLTHTYTQYVKSWIYIDWREYMTRNYMRRWLANHTHFVLQLQSNSESCCTESKKHLDNPDQRIQEDIHLFISSALDISLAFVHSMGNMFVFVPILLMLEPPLALGSWRFPGWLLILAALYSLMGSVCTHLIGWPLVGNNFARQKYEADFRHLALHVRDNAESVALYGSEPSEEKNLLAQFENIKRMQWQNMILTKRLAFFTSVYDFTQFLVPFFILAPAFFRKEISLGDLFQLTGAVGHVCGAFSWFLGNYGSLTEWRATADRLISFEDAISAIEPRAKQAASGVQYGDWIRTRSAYDANGRDDVPAMQQDPRHLDPSCLTAELESIRLPTGSMLWSDIQITAVPGERVLISGPEGVGKSILFKACAGIWPFVDGSVITLPAHSNQVLFVPQRPALPKLCSLADALAYPDLRDAYPTADLRQALRDVQLGEFLEDVESSSSDIDSVSSMADAASGGSSAAGRVDKEASAVYTTAMAATTGRSPLVAAGMVLAAKLAQASRSKEKIDGNQDDAGSGLGLDRREDWGLRLSPGQQQRLAIGHVLLKSPQVVFLDEATSNVGKEGAVQLYGILKTRLPKNSIVVSVSHDTATLEPLHDVHFSVCDDGGDSRSFRKVAGRGQSQVKGRCGVSS